MAISQARLKAVEVQQVEIPAKKSGKKAVEVDDRGVIGQLRLAAQPKNRLALVVGVLLGGLVPVLSFWLAHHEIAAESGWMILTQVQTYLVLGGLAYSAKSVYQWGKEAFHCGWKAVGFLILVEGTMVFSGTMWLSVIALVYLVGINAVSTGVNLALGKK
jgi:hypothetical protein